MGDLGTSGTRLSRPAPDWHAGGFGLYVHWPFCLSKCPYCDFNSHVWRVVDHAAWSDALVAEMRAMRERTGARPLDTMFFGGGTPSLMEPATVARLIAEADRLWGFRPGPEITLEANPTSVEAAKFRAYAAAGVNRLSMGVQALNDRDLRALGRTHSVAEARAAFDIARAAFGRVSFDLIYARQGQTPAAWEAELAEALAMAVDHLSLYQLTIEDGTRFADLHRLGKLAVPGDEAAVEMYGITQALTAAAGMPAYEVSNHARPGAESRHNLVYWRYGDYVGVGPGAHGRITRADGRRVATATIRDPARWLADAVTGALAEETVLDPAEEGEEHVLMGLRLAEGIDLDRHAALAGPIDAARIGALEAEGLVARRMSGNRARLVATAEGRLVLDHVIARLLA